MEGDTIAAIIIGGIVLLFVVGGVWYFIRSYIRKGVGKLLGLELFVKTQQVKRNDELLFKVVMNPINDFTANGMIARLYCQRTCVTVGADNERETEVDTLVSLPKVLCDTFHIPKGKKLVIKDSIIIPHDAMATKKLDFLETGIGLKWFLRIEVDIPRFPDAEKEVEIIVLP